MGTSKVIVATRLTVLGAVTGAPNSTIQSVDAPTSAYPGPTTTSTPFGVGDAAGGVGDADGCVECTGGTTVGAFWEGVEVGVEVGVGVGVGDGDAGGADGVGPASVLSKFMAADDSGSAPITGVRTMEATAIDPAAATPTAARNSTPRPAPAAIPSTPSAAMA